MIKRLLVVVLALAIGGAVYVFGIWKGFSGWSYGDVLAETQAELGKDRKVIAIEVADGSVGFVMQAKGKVEVRHYWRDCVVRDGDKVTNGTKFRGACQIFRRELRTITRDATEDDRGPTVPLGSFSPEAIKRLEAAGKVDYTDSYFLRGRWRFTEGIAGPDRTAAPDGTGVKPGPDSIGIENKVHAMVGDPPDE